MTAQAGGISKRGVHTKRALIGSVKKILNALSLFSGYDIQRIHVLYTHPGTRFFRKTVGTQTIKNPRGIYITREWFAAQREKLLSYLKKSYRHEVCAHLEVISIVADGEEILNDPYEYTANRSVRIEYVCVLVPATFIESITECVEQVTGVRQYKPAAVLNATLLSDEQKERGVIICDVGAEFTNVTAYRNGSLIGIRVIPFGGNTITNEIALFKKISPENAEEMKCSLSGDEPLLKKREVQVVDRKIAAYMKTELLTYIKELNGKKDFPDGIMLIGGGTRYQNLCGVIQKTTGLYTFHFPTPYHVQSQQHADQTVWQSAYALLYSAVTHESKLITSDNHRESSLWQWLMKCMHTISRVIR